MMPDNVSSLKRARPKTSQNDLFEGHSIKADIADTIRDEIRNSAIDDAEAWLLKSKKIYAIENEKPGKPSNLFEALEAIETQGALKPEKLKRLRSDIVCLGKALLGSHGKPDLKKIPSDPVALRPMLEAFHPARIRMKEKRWNNIKSQLRKSLELVDQLPKRRWHVLSSYWESALAPLTRVGQKAALGTLGAYCTERYIQPYDVTSEVIEEYLNYRAQNSLRTQLSSLKSNIRQCWQRLCEQNPDCGAVPLKKLPRYNRVALRDSELPPSFHDSVNAYFVRSRNPKPLDHKFQPMLAEETLRKRRTYIYLGANYLLDHGWNPDQLRGLADMLTPAAIEIILNEQFGRHSPDGKTWPAGAAPMASHLSRMAWQCANLSEADLKVINEFSKAARRKKHGFPAKTRERLASFDDEKTLRDFFKLPSVWWEKSQKFLKEGNVSKAATWAKYSLALAILLTKPLRISELAMIDFERDFVRNSKNKIRKLVIPGTRTKTGLPIEAEFDPALASRLDQYRKLFLPEVLHGEPLFLFPGKKDGHVTPNGLGQAIKKAVWDYLGIEVNAHLIRSLIATVIIDEDPNAIAVAQQMLGHINLETTISHYGMQRGRAAQKQYSKLMDNVLKRVSR